METFNEGNHFEEFEKYDVITDQDIFTKIWTQPKRIFKYINDKHYEKYLYILLFLEGVAKSFDRAISKNMGENNSLFFILLISIIFGGFLGWISYYIFAALLSWTGKWLDGKGGTFSIFRMMAYAMMPSVLSLAFLIPQIIVHGKNAFTSAEYDSGNFFVDIFSSVFSLIGVVLSLFSLVLLVIGLSQVQKFSIGKAILNLLLPIAVILVPILLIFFFAGGFS